MNFQKRLEKIEAELGANQRPILVVKFRDEILAPSEKNAKIVIIRPLPKDGKKHPNGLLVM